MPQYRLLDPRRRWVNAPARAVQLPLTLREQGRVLRDGDLTRVLSQAGLQQQERRACRRYRLHGELAPVSFLGRGSGSWSSLRELTRDQASAQGYLQDFFRDFTYQLCVPSRAEATAEPGIYRLYYRPVPGVEVEPLPGTLGCDIWGGGRFLFTVSQPFTLPDTGLEGLPLPLPSLEAGLWLTHRATSAYRDRREPPPAPASPAGFSMGQVTAAVSAAVVAWLAASLRPAAWRGWARPGLEPYVISRLVATWARLDLRFDLATVQLNRPLVEYALHLSQATSPSPYRAATQEWMGPLVRCEPARGEVEYLSEGVEYLTEQEVRLTSTPAAVAELRRLGYDYAPVEGAAGQLSVRFRFSWNPLVRIPLRALAEAEEESVDKAVGYPAWAWLNQNTRTWSWRDLLPTGERRGERGVEAPYVNDSHYIFARVAHYVGPDLSQRNALRAFATTLPRVVPGPALRYSSPVL